jgi:hypothetical protein
VSGDSNEEAIRHLETITRWMSESHSTAFADAFAWLVSDRARLQTLLAAQRASAPTRAATPEIRPGCTSPDYYEPKVPARTEAEQRVLDVMGAVPKAHLVDWHGLTVHVRHIPACHDLAVVELARRGLRP